MPSPSASTALPIPAGGCRRLAAAASLGVSRGATTVITGSRCAADGDGRRHLRGRGGTRLRVNNGGNQCAYNAKGHRPHLIIDNLVRQIGGSLHSIPPITRSHILDSMHGVSHKVGGHRLRTCVT
jgi:hypothetical protein